MLKGEFAKRESDLQKLEQAEERMNSEIKTLNEKLNKMQAEIENKFNKSEKYKEDCEQKVKRMLKNLTDLNEQRTAMGKEVPTIPFSSFTGQKRRVRLRAQGHQATAQRQLRQTQPGRKKIRSK
jgi:seryl-tRNA synthetase